MKNLFASTAFILLSLSLFCCNNSNDPQPKDTGSQIPTMAGYESAPVTTAAKIGNPVTDHPPITMKFAWKLVKTAVVPLYKGLNLTAPFAIVDQEAAGDISWGSDGGCYNAIKCQKLGGENLKIVDVNTVLPDYLKTLPFKKIQAAWAPLGSTFWTNYMPNGTVLAYKTNLGKYVLVVVKTSSPLTLDIYHESYYPVY
jgi:hypothetical protein